VVAAIAAKESIVSLVADQVIDTGATADQIRSTTPKKEIGFSASLQFIIVRSPIEIVIGVAAFEIIAANSAEDRIVATITDEGIISVVTDKAIAATGSNERVVAGSALGVDW
jgi:hypothetical protein